MHDPGLSPKQVQVINALSSGASITDAAAEAGVHRNTIGLWRRNLIDFQCALAHAQYDRALYFREKSEALADLAIDALRRALTDEKTPAGTRVRAALAILNSITTPPEPPKHLAPDIEKIHVNPTPRVIDEDQFEPANDMSAACAPDATQPEMHNSAQREPVQTIRREHPKVGRNDLCPCGSGLKHKRCCLHKKAAA